MRRLTNLLATTAIFGGVAYAYIYYHTAKNMKQYKAIIQAGTTKDASRLTNDSFGISWGFQADDIVMSKIDSGDYLFMKFDCSECLTVAEYVKCSYDSMFRLEEEIDSVGYAYRNSQGLWIFYNEFGETKVKSYQELVSLPYLKGLIIQKTTNKKVNFHKKLRDLLENEQGQVQIQKKKQSAINMANRINQILYDKSVQLVVDLRQLIQTSQQILVRTETNRTLRSL